MAAEHATRDRTEYHKAWRAANREKIKAYGAAYYVANKARLNAEANERYEANKESYKARAAEWARANRKKRTAITAKWRKARPEQTSEAARRSRARHRTQRLIAEKEYREKNRSIVRAARVAWRAAHPEANAHHVGLRRTRRISATPAWADLSAIKAIYKLASDMSKRTGVKYHVDHVVPLTNPLVCGLHCEFNLRVITAAENQTKKNRL